MIHLLSYAWRWMALSNERVSRAIKRLFNKLTATYTYIVSMDVTRGINQVVNVRQRSFWSSNWNLNDLKKLSQNVMLFHTSDLKEIYKPPFQKNYRWNAENRNPTSLLLENLHQLRFEKIHSSLVRSKI